MTWKADDYQQACLKTVKHFDTSGEQALFAAALLSAEAGEALNLMVKVAFQGHPLDDVKRRKLVEEAGDALWSAAVLLDALGVSLSECMAANQRKLTTRYPLGHFSPAQSLARRDVDSAPEGAADAAPHP